MYCANVPSPSASLAYKAFFTFAQHPSFQLALLNRQQKDILDFEDKNVNIFLRFHISRCRRRQNIFTIRQRVHTQYDAIARTNLLDKPLVSPGRLRLIRVFSRRKSERERRHEICRGFISLRCTHIYQRGDMSFRYQCKRIIPRRRRCLPIYQIPLKDRETLREEEKANRLARKERRLLLSPPKKLYSYLKNIFHLTLIASSKLSAERILLEFKKGII